MQRAWRPSLWSTYRSGCPSGFTATGCRSRRRDLRPPERGVPVRGGRAEGDGQRQRERLTLALGVRSGGHRHRDLVGVQAVRPDEADRTLDRSAGGGTGGAAARGRGRAPRADRRDPNAVVLGVLHVDGERPGRAGGQWADLVVRRDGELSRGRPAGLTATGRADEKSHPDERESDEQGETVVDVEATHAGAQVVFHRGLPPEAPVTQSPTTQAHSHHTAAAVLPDFRLGCRLTVPEWLRCVASRTGY